MRLEAIAVYVLLVAHGSPASSAPSCEGEYGEDLAALSQHARELEATSSTYLYAVRTTATYECVSYGSDGNLKRTHTTTVVHGTAFGYRRDGGDTLLLTNDYVAAWPEVTDGDHPPIRG